MRNDPENAGRPIGMGLCRQMPKIPTPTAGPIFLLFLCTPRFFLEWLPGRVRASSCLTPDAREYVACVMCHILRAPLHHGPWASKTWTCSYCNETSHSVKPAHVGSAIRCCPSAYPRGSNGPTASARPSAANTGARHCFLASAPGPKLWPDVYAVIKLSMAVAYIYIYI
jgi:hypothetical protein